MHGEIDYLGDRLRLQGQDERFFFFLVVVFFFFISSSTLFLGSFVAMATLRNGQGQLQPGIANISPAHIRFVSANK